MSVTKITDVLSTRAARIFVSIVDVIYKTPNLKAIIFDSKYDDDYLLITKTIGSSPIVIDDVKVIDDALIDSFFKWAKLK